MNKGDEREIEALRERSSKLSAAMLRISESLDLQTVLQEIASAARALTGARCTVLVAIDESRAPHEFVTSGLTADEHRLLLEWPDGERLFEHFRDLPGPFSLGDVAAYVRSLGFRSDVVPFGTIHGTPMHHRDVHVGSFFLLDKGDGTEFNDEDANTLRLFAAHAAAAIANARTHDSERRARARLEVLIETTPVGVAVFDVAGKRPVSFNREAARIVESLRTPGRPVEELMGMVICHRGDGSEVSLGRLSLAAALQNAEAIHAEEVTLSVANGRSVTTLINVTPIRSGEAVESVVVTMQDMTPLQELERARSEFLSMVSHELRTPLAAIKGSTATVLSASRGYGPAEMLQFFHIIDEQTDLLTGLIGDLLDVGRIETGALSVYPVPSEVGALVDRARNTFLAGGGRHTLLIDLAPDLPRVMADQGRILQVINNLVVNAARHSPESSPIRIAALHDGTHVAVSVADQGRGIAPHDLPQLFQKRARSSGRGPGTGMGLAICRGLVETHGGRIRAESRGIGKGARFTFTIPVADEPDATGGAAPSRQGRSRDGGRSTPILVLDDDPQHLRFVRDTLANAGYAPLVSADHRNLSQIISAESPALVLLDLMLHGTDGIMLMETVSEMADVPVIFLSGYDREETIARALDAGAEDYILKPCSPTELVARVRAALRRRADPEVFSLSDLTIDYDRRLVSMAGRAVVVTPTEYELLKMLSRNAGQVMTYDTLLRQVWHTRHGDPRVVRAFVKQLRKKLGDDADNPTYIVNERGLGYRMPHPPERRMRV